MRKLPETIWLVTFFGRGEEGDGSDAVEAYASEGGALRGIATILREWVDEFNDAVGYVSHAPTRKKLSTLLQREHYRAALMVWNDYAKRLHDPADLYGIGLIEVPFDPSRHPVVEEADVESAGVIDADFACSTGCPGFRIGKMGELWPCDGCDLDDGQAHDRVQALIRANPPEKKDHESDECGPSCRGWDLFEVCGSEAIKTPFAILRSDMCGVFADDDEAVSSACKFLSHVTGTPFDKLLADKPQKWCAKCGAPMFFPDKEWTLCVECGDRKLPQHTEGADEWCCDSCGTDVKDVVPSVGYDNSLATALGAVLCEPCGTMLSKVPIEQAVAKIAKVWHAKGYEDSALRLCKQFSVTPPWRPDPPRGIHGVHR